ncbi:MAG: DUF2182 domain-containing protein [Rhodospirillales bacterium]|nr:DUF2182 domain-containing protein [Rhodospirillales bacterium]MBO6785675.1 DUF2182 domain-containing protein [Rhodospirillales bacterium]
MQSDFLSAMLRKDRLLAVLALAAVCVAAWAYTAFGVGMKMSAIDMTGMPLDMPMPLTEWNFRESLLMFFMWWVMMVAMMLPSAAPMLLLYQRVVARRTPAQAASGMAVFTLGYLLIWGAFSLAATALHVLGELTGWVNGMMASASNELNAVLLISAGIWQLTPMKDRCLEACRAPVQFLSRIWRPGAWGALKMGVLHGAFCVGCCWAMMLLLFVGGVMNLYWIGGLALFVMAEKTVPNWRFAGRLAGGILIVSGGVLFLGG